MQNKILYEIFDANNFLVTLFHLFRHFHLYKSLPNNSKQQQCASSKHCPSCCLPSCWPCCSRLKQLKLKREHPSRHIFQRRHIAVATRSMRRSHPRAVEGADMIQIFSNKKKKKQLLCQNVKNEMVEILIRKNVCFKL